MAPATQASDRSGRIDVHHHFVPKVFAEAVKASGYDPKAFGILPDWSLEGDLEFSRKSRIGTALLSLTAPGTLVVEDPTKQAALARQANLEAAQIRDARPSQYGFFAALPSLVHTQLAIAEIDFALDELKADGVTVFTSYGDLYLGSPDLKPVWDHLNERGAVVFVHPMYNYNLKLVNPSLPQPMMDWTNETTRTACDMITSGTIRAHPCCKVILSHAGGTLPYIAARPACMLPHTSLGKGITEQGFMEDAKMFYFDTALSTSAIPLNALLQFAAPGHVLYGSDYPYAPELGIHEMNARLDENIRGEQLDCVDRLNALKLFPRLGAS